MKPLPYQPRLYSSKPISNGDSCTLCSSGSHFPPRSTFTRRLVTQILALSTPDVASNGFLARLSLTQGEHLRCLSRQYVAYIRLGRQEDWEREQPTNCHSDERLHTTANDRVGVEDRMQEGSYETRQIMVELRDLLAAPGLWVSGSSSCTFARILLTDLCAVVRFF